MTYMGFNVYAGEVENALFSHPALSMAAAWETVDKLHRDFLE